jgi:hypothetical protein
MTKMCDPNDCAITQRLDIKRSTKAEKQKLAEYYYSPECGWTMERIAEALGVTHKTVSVWLSEFVPNVQIKPAKTPTNPKGAGRPKGKKSSPKTDRAREAVRQAVTNGQPVSRSQLKDEGIGETSVHLAVATERGRLEGLEEAAALAYVESTKSAKEKLEIAIRQSQRKLETEFEQRILAEVEQRLNQVVLPAWRETIEWAEAVSRREKGIMTAVEYKLLRTCLHPDRVQDESLRRKFADAFSIVERLERFLCKPEKEPPATFPRTWQEAQSSSSERDCHHG